MGGAGAGEVRFDRREEVTRGKNIWELFRGWLVFKLFTYNTIVDNSMKVCQFAWCVQCLCSFGGA